MSDTPVTPISDWQLEPNVTCVVCPRCAFTFDAVHEDVPNGGHSCPLCEIDRQAQVIAERDATIAELRAELDVWLTHIEALALQHCTRCEQRLADHNRDDCVGFTPPGGPPDDRVVVRSEIDLPPLRTERLPSASPEETQP